MTVERSEKGAVVKVDGKPFAEYLTRAGHQPAVWPVIGPTGKAMTRSYPAGPLLDGEMNDHPHHHSIWFTHGDVNGRDFWTKHKQSHQNSEIKHREFVELEGGDDGQDRHPQRLDQRRQENAARTSGRWCLARMNSAAISISR